MTFQIYVVLIAIILTSLLLYIINNTITKQAKNVNWPSYVPNCPDYWIDFNGDGTKCVSTGFNTTSKCSGTMDFSGKYCSKVQKATVECSGLIWDGVTYGAGNNIRHNKCKGVSVLS